MRATRQLLLSLLYFALHIWLLIIVPVPDLIADAQDDDASGPSALAQANLKRKVREHRD